MTNFKFTYLSVSVCLGYLKKSRKFGDSELLSYEIEL